MDQQTESKRRKPDWLKVRFSNTEETRRVKHLIKDLNLNTVCSSARCPNVCECWSRGTATFMILGNVCTRNCHFCNVTHGHPSSVDNEEPVRVARAIKKLNLRHAVITSVTRDDLPDGGASLFAATVQQIRLISPETTLEILTPDFMGDKKALRTIITCAPDVFNHNLETVRRLTPVVRPSANYDRSLFVIEYIKKHSDSIAIKSGLMLGLGETRDETLQSMEDLRYAGCEILTLGQYLQPGKEHLKVAEFIRPEEFKKLEKTGLELGFHRVFSGPLVRSSYMAELIRVK
jgi:lipoic acid synthetase